MYRQSEKKLVKQQYLPHMSSQYGELRPTNGWDPFRSLEHLSKFKRVSRLRSVTAQHSSSGRQPNFAALNRGRHLYSAGRPSRWALAHILVLCSFFLLFFLAFSQWLEIGCLPYFYTWCGLSANLEQLCWAVSSQLRYISTIGKNLLNSNISSTCPHNMVNFGPLAAEISSGVWGTPANFNGFHV